MYSKNSVWWSISTKETQSPVLTKDTQVITVCNQWQFHTQQSISMSHKHKKIFALWTAWINTYTTDQYWSRSVNTRQIMMERGGGILTEQTRGYPIWDPEWGAEWKEKICEKGKLKKCRGLSKKYVGRWWQENKGMEGGQRVLVPCVAQ